MKIKNVITQEAEKHEFMALVAQAMRDAKIESHPLIVTFEIKKDYPRRSLKQNALLWGVIYPQVTAQIYMKTGKAISSEDIHNYIFKPMFCGDEVLVIGGKTHLIPKSSTELDTLQFTDAVDKFIAMMVRDYGLEIELSRGGNADA